MGKLVNVVLWDGTVTAVDAETAKQLGQYGRAETPEENLNAAIAQEQKAQSAGFHEGAKTAAEGLLDAVSFGGFGKLVGTADSEWAENMQVRGQERPGARLAGEAMGYLAPFGAASAAGRVGHAAAGAIEGAGAKAVGRMVEGSLLGAGATVAHSNVTGDQLTVEGVVEGAGIGGILNVGVGALTDRLLSGATKVRDRVLREKADTELFEKRVSQIRDNSVYTEAKEAHNAAQTGKRKIADKLSKERDAYNARWIDNDTAFKAAVARAETVINTVKKRPNFAETVERPLKVAGEMDNPTIQEMEAALSPADQMAMARDPAASAEYWSSAARVAGKPQPVTLDATMEVGTAQAHDLKEFRARISDIYKKRAGEWELTGPDMWRRNPSVPADPEGALADLRQLQADMAVRFPKASAKLGSPIPAPPVALDEVISAKLPADLKKFAGWKEDRVAALANELDNVTAGKFEELATDLGFGVGATPAETLARLHSGLNETFSAIAKNAESKKGTSGVLNWLMDAAKNATAAAVGFKTFGMLGGGMLGAAGGAAGRTAARIGMGGVEDAVLSGELISAREGLRSKVRDLVATHSTGIGKAAKLGPVTSVLSTRFLSQDKDEEGGTDLDRAVRRINEIHTLGITAPDAIYTAVESMLGHTSDMAWKTHNHIVNALRYLGHVAPKDPGLDRKMGVSNWTPSHQETVAFAHAMEAVVDPSTAIKRAFSGDGHEAATDALWAVWPGTMQDLAGEVAVSASTDLNYRQASDFSQLFRTPLTPLQEPDVALTIQGTYLAAMQQQMAAAQASQPQAQAGGRPPAVQSKVAGSSVAGLIS